VDAANVGDILDKVIQGAFENGEDISDVEAIRQLR
jgi:hypothetical protein